MQLEVVAVWTNSKYKVQTNKEGSIWTSIHYIPGHLIINTLHQNADIYYEANKNYVKQTHSPYSRRLKWLDLWFKPDIAAKSTAVFPEIKYKLASKREKAKAGSFNWGMDIQ